MSRTAQLQDWWRARNSRERLWVTVMLAMLMAFAYWYGLLRPLHALRVAAQAQYDQAAGELHAVRSEVAAIRQHRARMPSGDGSVVQYVLQSAAAAGLELRRTQPDTPGQLAVTTDGSATAVLFGWLESLRHERGIVPVSLRVARSGDRLRAEMVFDSEVQ